jgi:voltage-gated potassium channel
LPHWAAKGCHIVDVVVWAVFAVDLAVRLILTDQRGRFLLMNWLDVITLALPMFRPLRVLRAVLALSVLTRRGCALARGRVVAAVVAAVSVVGFVAALAVLDAERANPAANIRSFPDALWWAATTITSVGYGDRFPTTTQGRVVAGVLMLTGIAMLGVVTAALASWFIERLAVVQTPEENMSSDVADLVAQVAALRDEIRVVRVDVGDETRKSGM